MAARIGKAVLLALVALPLVALGASAALGFKRAVVLTGSMEPTYPVGSMTVVEPLEPIEVAGLRAGDPIMFWSPDDTTQSVTHRVVEVRPEGFITRGDANNTADAWVVPHDHVIGRVRWHVPRVGVAASWVRDPATTPWVVGAAAVAFILNELVSLVRAAAARRSGRRPAVRTSVRPPDLDLRARSA